jgi:hypothetical protein
VTSTQYGVALLDLARCILSLVACQAGSARPTTTKATTMSTLWEIAKELLKEDIISGFVTPTMKPEE